MNNERRQYILDMMDELSCENSVINTDVDKAKEILQKHANMIREEIYNEKISEKKDELVSICSRTIKEYFGSILYGITKCTVDTFLKVTNNPLLDINQQAVVLCSLYEGYNIIQFADKGFNFKQLLQINRGLRDNLDISKFAKLEYTSINMSIIRTGLINGVDTTDYIDFDPVVVEHIIKCIKNGIDVSIFTEIPDISYTEITQLESVLSLAHNKRINVNKLIKQLELIMDDTLNN